MHPLCRRQFIDRAFPTERLEDHLRLQLPTMLSPRQRHRGVLPNGSHPNLLGGPVFGVHYIIRWVDHKYGVVRQQHEWVKVHLMCGVKTNVVTAVEIREKDASDTKLLPDLVNATATHFDMREVSADKGYSSVNNTNVIASYGATPYIAFKSIHSGAAGGLWEKMFHYFAFNRLEFLGHYHKRSNAESTFSMIKAKFRDHVRSKTDVAMTNEVLCKILCHNICCVIQAMYELGIEPTFWENRASGHQAGEITLHL